MSRRRHLRFILLATLALACGLPSLAMPSPPPSLPAPPAVTAAAPAPLSGTPVAVDQQSLPGANRFAPYALPTVQPAERSAEIQRELTSLANQEALRELTEEQRQALAEEGFVVAPVPASDLVDVYRRAGAAGWPIFVTADLVLHSVDTLVDVSWQQAIVDVLLADLRVLSAEMATASLVQWEESRSRAAHDNLAFFAVASRMLDPEFNVAAPVAAVVADELTLIEEGGVYVSPLFGERLDYDTFSPSLPEGVDPSLKLFHHAVAWLSHPFSLETDDPATLRKHSGQALLMARALESRQNWPRWARVYWPLHYFNGDTQPLSVEHVAAASITLYGRLPEEEPERLDDLVATLREMHLPSGFDPSPASLFRFLPERLFPEQPLFRELVFNRVGVYEGARPLPATAVQTAIGAVRGLPRSLDLAAALGSTFAGERLETEGDGRYQGYQEQMAYLRNRFSSFDEPSWTKTLSGAQLFASQPLLTPPASAQLSPSQVARQFNAWFGALVEGRQPAVLAQLPAGTSIAIAAPSYVEAQPRLYARLAALVRQVGEGLGTRDLLNRDLEQRLQQMALLLDGLQRIAESELAGQRLSADEALLAREAPARLVALTTFVDENGQEWRATLPSIATLYVDPQSGRALQTAVGEAWRLYTLIPGADGPLLALGSIFSSYELQRPPDGILVPSTWHEMEARPAPASWTELLLMAEQPQGGSITAPAPSR